MESKKYSGPVSLMIIIFSGVCGFIAGGLVFGVCMGFGRGQPDALMGLIGIIGFFVAFVGVARFVGGLFFKNQNWLDK